MKNKSYYIQNARLWLRRVLPSIMFVILAHNFAVAQPAVIFLKTTVTVKTRLGGVTEKEVFTEHGRFLLRDISRITFWEEAPDSAKIIMLRTHGIVVFRKMERLATIKPKDTEPEYHSIGSVGFGFGLDYGGIGYSGHLVACRANFIFRWFWILQLQCRSRMEVSSSQKNHRIPFSDVRLQRCA